MAGPHISEPAKAPHGILQPALSSLGREATDPQDVEESTFVLPAASGLTFDGFWETWGIWELLAVFNAAYRFLKCQWCTFAFAQFVVDL